jgi:Flp pilus assembly protein CpaB
MVVAGILAFVTNLVVLRGRDDTQTVASAGRAIEAGVRVGPSDLRPVPLDASSEVLATLLGWDQIASIDGMVATRTIAIGQLLAVADFRAPAAGFNLRAMSIPVEPEHAVGGNLAPGDRVDVIRVVEGLAAYVVTGAEILSVASEERGGITGAVDFYVVLAVDADTALSLSEAINSGDLEVVRSTGSTPVETER